MDIEGVLTPERKEWIDSSDYETLLRRWRFGPTTGSTMFIGECGEYYAKAMFAARDKESDGGVIASKRVGWG